MRPIVNVSPNNPVFDLPIYVARDEGLFEKAGLEVRFGAKYSQRNLSDADPFKRLKEALFEQGNADVYNLCEWAGIDRSQRSARGAQVLALRPAVAAQAILSFDKNIQEPRDLAACEPYVWHARGFGDFWQHVLVAEGSLEAAVDARLSLWDYAAPALIVAEAGGRASAVDGAPLRPGAQVVTSNGLLHDDVLALLRS